MKSTRWRDLGGLFCLSLIVRLSVAALVPRPGYMDVAYYAAGAVRLAQGGGLHEPFLWNYLDDPVGLPHPGFLYWAPLPALLAAPFARLFPGSFFALQFPFVLLSALLPLVAYSVAWETTRRRRAAWIAGLLALFSGFFFPYWTLPETFAPCALLGSLALWLAGYKGQDAGCRMQDTQSKRKVIGLLVSLLVGLLVGLGHLTRADGILLLPVVALAPLLSLPSPGTRHTTRNAQHAPRSTHHATRTTHYTPRLFICHWFIVHCSLFIVHCSLFILGYLLVMAPWFLRNLSAVGALFSSSGVKTLWLRTYDDLFCYSCDLSWRSYLAWGWSNILRSKLWAAGVNLERFLAEDCLIFLLPFVLIGLYRLRRHPPFLLSLIYLSLIYSVHSLAFTFPGPRGGFFHASAPALPFLFTAGVEGVEAAVGWAARRRRWNLQQARLVFGMAPAVLAVFLSIYAAVQTLPAWHHANVVYGDVGRWLAQEGTAGGTVVMVANPPAFWYHTGYRAVVVPNGDVEIVLALADRYGVQYVLLDRNRPAPLAELYPNGTLNPRLRRVAVWGEGEARVVLYKVEPASSSADRRAAPLCSLGCAPVAYLAHRVVY